MRTLKADELRRICPVKWHKDIPKNGISLGVADIDFEGPGGVIPYIKSNLKNDFLFYQDQQGLPKTITSIIKFLSHKNITAYPANIQVIEGTMMGISIVMKWISRIDGDVAVLGPIYEPIHRHATTEGNQIKWIGMTDNQPDMDELQEKVNQDTKMIVLCNPNNPTGHVYKYEELKLIRDLCLDYDVYIFSDELYEPLTEGNHISVASVDGLQERSILLYGFSKAYGLAGLRSGFMFLGPSYENIRYIASQQMVSPSPITSLVAEYALTSSEVSRWVSDFWVEVKDRTNFASEYLQDKNIDCPKPEGSFFIFPKFEGINDEKFADSLLKEKGVQVVPGSRFGPMGESHLRINCATSEERLEEGLSRISGHFLEK